MQSVRHFFLEKGYDNASLERVAADTNRRIVQAPYISGDFRVSPDWYIEDRAEWERLRFPLTELIAKAETRSIHMARTGEKGTLSRTSDGRHLDLKSDDGTFSERYSGPGGVSDLFKLLIAFDALLGDPIQEA